VVGAHATTETGGEMLHWQNFSPKRTIYSHLPHLRRVDQRCQQRYSPHRPDTPTKVVPTIRGRAPVPELLSEYAPILIFLGMAIGLGLVLLLAAIVVAVSNPDPEKVSAYECGFNAFDDARMKFDVRFYLVAILFIIFDLEIAFLFPWAVAFSEVSMTAFWSMMVFLAVLTIGFAYEWKKGALEWE